MPAQKHVSPGTGAVPPAAHGSSHGTNAHSATAQRNGLGHVQSHTRHPQQTPLASHQYPYPSLHTAQQPDSILNGHHATTTPSGGFFMKPLTSAPDYRFNLYVKGLPATTNTRALYDLFKPHGEVLACKILLDNDNGTCKGGFVLFDNQESCTEARRELTLQGLYVTVAHDSACIKNLPAAESPSLEIKLTVPEFDNSDAFPSLPSKPAKKKPQQQSKHKSATTSSMKASSTSTLQPEKTSHQADSNHLSNPVSTIEAEEAKPIALISQSNEAVQRSGESPSSHNQDVNDAFILGHSYLDFDSGFIGSHQQLLSEGFSNGSKYDRRSTFLDKPCMGVEDIDRYMQNMLEMSTASGAPQASSNMDERHANGAYISNTTIDDFMLEDRPRRDATLHFENLPEGLKYQELFELCAQYGSLILSSVDIRYINEECFGQGRVTFESYRDSESAFSSLMEKNFNVHHGDSAEMFPTEPAIDDYLYEQYFQQHQDLLRLRGSSSAGTPEEMATLTFSQQDFFSTFSNGAAAQISPVSPEFHDQEHYWRTPPPDEPSPFEVGSSPVEYDPNTVESIVESLSIRQENLGRLGDSPHPMSLQPRLPFPPSSRSETPPVCTELSISEPRQHTATPSAGEGSEDMSETEESDDSEPCSSSKLLSYSDIVKVPPKPPALPLAKDGTLYQDLKKRGNTNKSLDEKEYNLNLFLKNLEPTMNEFKLYEICVQFGPVLSCRTITTNHGVCTGLGFVMYISNRSCDLAIEGLKKLGYHAEPAIASATNKLRCKTLSDLLFIQNIPRHIKENKLRDLFRPYTLLMCHILRDPKTGKSRGVGFLKVKDTSVAERLIEEYHGRVLGKDWKLPIQVSPAKQGNPY